MRDLSLQKARQRAELEQLTAKYLSDGGEVHHHRNAGLLDVVCSACGLKERLPMQVTTWLGLRCRRCGGRARVN